MSTTLITGASSGIGAELARRFAERGDDLVLVARRLDRLEVLAEEVRRHHRADVEVIPMDLAEPSAATELWERLADRRVDTLVNNAGIGAGGRVADDDPERLEAVVALNCRTLVGLTGRFLKPMVARGSGTIINIASTAAFQPLPNTAVYAASKAMVLSFTQALWAEARPEGVRVLAACPGTTDTEFFDSSGVSATVGSMRTTAQFADALFARLEGTAPSFVDGMRNRVLAAAGVLMPRRLLLKLAAEPDQPA